MQVYANTHPRVENALIRQIIYVYLFKISPFTALPNFISFEDSSTFYTKYRYTHIQYEATKLPLYAGYPTFYFQYLMCSHVVGNVFDHDPQIYICNFYMF